MKKLILKLTATILVLSLAIMSTMVSFAATTLANSDKVQGRIERQMARLKEEGLKSVDQYVMQYGEVPTIKKISTTLVLSFNVDEMEQEELERYSLMTDDEIYDHLNQIYNETASNFQKANDLQKEQLENLKASLENLEALPVPRSGSTPVTKSRSNNFTAPILDAMGYAEMTAYYEATCQNNLFTGGKVTGCKLRQGLAIGTWQYISGSVYPVLETDNGRYLAYQVRGQWTILKDGVTISGEKVYDFTDNNPF